MKNSRGFTLVELLAVIVLLGLITIIAVPLVQRTSNRIKENVLETKISSAEKAFLLWAQENEKCFMDGTGRDCIVQRGTYNNSTDIGCAVDAENSDNLICKTTLGTLAANYLITYDKDNKIINPTDDTDISDQKVIVIYNAYKRIFTYGNVPITHTTKTPITHTTTTRPITTVPIYSESAPPVITLNIETDTTWAKRKDVTVSVQDFDSGLAAGGTFRYGWSTSNTTQPSNLQGPVSLTYTAGTTAKISTSIYNNTLSGKLYLWIIPNISDRSGNQAQTKVSNGTFWLDNAAPGTMQMNFVYGDWTFYDGNWTNKNLYAARSQAEKTPSGGVDNESGLDKFQISTNNSTWTDYAYVSNAAPYRMNTEGTFTRYFRACDKVGNCNASISVVGKIDKTKPTVESMTATTANITFSLKDNRSGVASYCLIDTTSSTGCSWITVNNSPLTTGNLTVTNPHPGKKVYLFAKDAAGNISNSANSDTSCIDIVYEDGTTCTKACGSGTYNRLAYDAHSGVRCASQDKTSGGSACNTQTCCSSTVSCNCTYSSWSACTKECGGGTQTRTKTCSKCSAYDNSACSGTTSTNESRTCNNDPCEKTMYYCVQGNIYIHETLENLSCNNYGSGRCYTKNNVWQQTAVVYPTMRVSKTQKDGGSSGYAYYHYYELVTPINYDGVNYKYIVFGCLKDSKPTTNCNTDSWCAG